MQNRKSEHVPSRIGGNSSLLSKHAAECACEVESAECRFKWNLGLRGTEVEARKKEITLRLDFSRHFNRDPEPLPTKANLPTLLVLSPTQKRGNIRSIISKSSQ